MLTRVGGLPQPLNRETLLACWLLCATGGGETGRIECQDAYARLLRFAWGQPAAAMQPFGPANVLEAQMTKGKGQGGKGKKGDGKGKKGEGKDRGMHD